MSLMAVVRKDVLSELRSRDTLVAILLLALLTGTVGLLAFHDIDDHAAVTSAILWTTLAFAAALGLARAFGAERDQGTLDTLLALPIERTSIYLAKTAASALLLAITALVITPIYALASGRPTGSPALVLFLILGIVGLAATGTILSALAVHARSRDILMPILLFPLVVPLLIAAIHGTQDVLHGEPFSAWRPELLLLLGYDLAFISAGALLADQAVAT